MSSMKFELGQTVYVMNDTDDGVLSGTVVENQGGGRVGVVGIAPHFGGMVLSFPESSLSADPDEVKPRPGKDPNACHYCGRPGVSKGFFGESVCEQCGG